MLIFLHGSDTYRSRQKRNEIITEYRERSESGIDLVVIDALDDDCEMALDRAVRTQTMFDERRLTVVERLSAVDAEVRGRVMTLLQEQDQPDALDVIVIWEEELSAAHKKDLLFSWLLEHGIVQEFSSLHGAALRRWIQHKAAALELTVAPDGLKVLIEMVGEDTWRLSSELHKLKNFSDQRFSKEDPVVIDASTVRRMVQPTVETDIFRTIDALGQRDKEQAVRLLRDHLERGEEELRILAMLAYQVRLLLQVKDLIDRGISFRNLAQAADIHPYVAKKTHRQAKLFSYRELQRAHQLLYDLDRRVKCGLILPHAAVEQFILSI